ncbi:MAG: Rieske 2Fe-2S domain-containing protein [Streptosporangiales bacterium]|nr:Rieske 2Fe-2S domain-containing protein [Streptosporangiales bacterium]
MLTSEETEYLCRVGPDTPIGRVLRRYWIPAFQLADLPRPDCPPIAVPLLGERFVAFRDTEGRLGFLDELCCHRGASLALGRVEDCGLRCIYHGWKYGVDGTIQETPNMPESSRFKERVKHPAYPVREAGGLGWVYLGPPDRLPSFPEYHWFGVPQSQLLITEMILDCNWVQVQEGSIDSSHVGILHTDSIAEIREGKGRRTGLGNLMDGFPSEDNSPRLEVENTDFGFHYAAVRQASDGEDRTYVRITPFIMPFITYIPPTSNNIVIVVPRDNWTTSSIGVRVNPTDEPIDLWAAWRAQGVDDPEVWGPEPERRRVRLPAQDRPAMEEGRSFAGIQGIRMQDAVVQSSMGRIYDRRNEHLVPADVGIIRMRRLLIESARRVDQGEDPIGLDRPVDAAKIEAASGTIPADVPWQSLVPGNRAV